MLSIQVFTFNAFQENTYVLYDETHEAVIIDPGCSDRGEERALGDFISRQQLIPKYLLNTHCHVDHVLGNYFVQQTYRVPFLMHRLDEPTLRSVKLYAPLYGVNTYQETLPDSFLEEGDQVVFGNQQLKVLFLPGHAPGHVGFYHQAEKQLVAGDVLFQHSIGRTDLPGGNFETLIDSIHQKLFTLPDEVVVYPGHGPTTTIGEEKVSNPFCALTLR
jgi:glyoxylase-like metal-dependent hydrolase (beta-lactamase superfamily II)